MNKKFFTFLLIAIILTITPNVTAEKIGSSLETKLETLEKDFEIINNKKRKSGKDSKKNKLQIASLYIQGTWQVCKERHFDDENKNLSLTEKIKLSFYTTREICSQIKDMCLPDSIKDALTFTTEHLKSHRKKYLSLIAILILKQRRLLNLSYKETLLTWTIMFVMEDFILP